MYVCVGVVGAEKEREILTLSSQNKVENKIIGENRAQLIQKSC